MMLHKRGEEKISQTRDLFIGAGTGGAWLLQFLTRSEVQTSCLLPAQLDTKDARHHLAWLPPAFPRGVYALTSVSEKHPVTLDRVKIARPTELQLREVDVRTRQQIAQHYLGAYNKVSKKCGHINQTPNKRSELAPQKQLSGSRVKSPSTHIFYRNWTRSRCVF